MMRTKKKKQNEWPFKPENNPIALALNCIDNLLDRIQHKKQKQFDESSISQLHNLNKAQLAELNNQLKLTLEGIKGAVENDAFWREAYSNFDKDQLKIVLAYLKAVRSMKPSASANGKIRVSGPRKHKQKDPEKIVKSVLFLPKDPETAQTSLQPKELVGAHEMWVYNSKTRKLGCYYAKNDSGLSAKGTTILNYDEKRSTTKTVRKPQQQVKDFMLAGRKYWDSIKAVPQEISPRLNRETLILRIAR